MKTKAFRKKLTADLKSVTKNCLKPVEKTHATENEKKLLASVISDDISPSSHLRTV